MFSAWSSEKPLMEDPSQHGVYFTIPVSNPETKKIISGEVTDPLKIFAILQVTRINRLTTSVSDGFYWAKVLEVPKPAHGEFIQYLYVSDFPEEVEKLQSSNVGSFDGVDMMWAEPKEMFGQTGWIRTEKARKINRQMQSDD